MALYLAGHGDWNVRDSKVPYAKVPRGCTIYFYTDNGRTLSTAAMAMIAIERGDSAVIPAAGDILGDSNGSSGEYATVPNYTLYPDTPDKCKVLEAVIGAGNVRFVDQATPLCTGVGSDGRACIDSGMPVHTCNGLFAGLEGQEIVWLACRALGLEAAGGDAIGVNALQPAGEATEWDEWENEAWGNFASMSPDDFWTYVEGLDDRQKAAVLTWDAVRERLLAEGRI